LKVVGVGSGEADRSFRSVNNADANGRNAFLIKNSSHYMVVKLSWNATPFVRS
jgi:hypothetical protein